MNAQDNLNLWFPLIVDFAAEYECLMPTGPQIATFVAEHRYEDFCASGRDDALASLFESLA